MELSQSDLNLCETTIVKIAKNHVNVNKVLYAKDGKEVIVATEEYGQNRIDSEKAEAQKKYDYWDGLAQTKIDEKKAKYQQILTDIVLIQTEMDKS